MSEQQIERLDEAWTTAFNRVFAARRSDLSYFGYGLMDASISWERLVDDR